MMVLIPLMAAVQASRSAAEKLPPRVEAMKLMRTAPKFLIIEINIFVHQRDVCLKLK